MLAHKSPYFTGIYRCTRRIPSLSHAITSHQCYVKVHTSYDTRLQQSFAPRGCGADGLTLGAKDFTLDAVFGELTVMVVIYCLR